MQANVLLAGNIYPEEFNFDLTYSDVLSIPESLGILIDEVNRITLLENHWNDSRDMSRAFYSPVKVKQAKEL